MHDLRISWEVQQQRKDEKIAALEEKLRRAIGETAHYRDALIDLERETNWVEGQLTLEGVTFDVRFRGQLFLSFPATAEDVAPIIVTADLERDPRDD